MQTVYLDTSAAMKLVIDEAESDALVDDLASADDRRLVSSWLLHTEITGRPAGTPATSTSTPYAPCSTR